MTHDSPLIVPQWDGVLANAADPAGNPLTAVVVAGPNHGSLALNPAGSFTYTPQAGFFGTDSFTFQAGDGTLSSLPATVLIDVTESAPVAGDVTYLAAANETLFAAAGQGVLAEASDADGDALQAVLVAGIHHGTLVFGASGSFSYTPAPGFAGSDAFTFQVSDGMETSNVATATIIVGPTGSPALTPPPPVVVPDSYTTPHDQPLVVAAGDGVLANDNDPEAEVSEAEEAEVSGTVSPPLELSRDGLALEYSGFCLTGFAREGRIGPWEGHGELMWALVYHVLNRANRRAQLFTDPGHYRAFVQTLAEAQVEHPMRLLAYCVLPNNWHLVLWPEQDGSLSTFVGWLTLTHTQRWHASQGSAGAGHLYQGRFKSFVVEADAHLFTVNRNVERNALRAGLVRGRGLVLG